MLKTLLKLANKLDQLGFYSEADQIDEILKQAGMSPEEYEKYYGRPMDTDRLKQLEEEEIELKEKVDSLNAQLYQELSQLKSIMLPHRGSGAGGFYVAVRPAEEVIEVDMGLAFKPDELVKKLEQLGYKKHVPDGITATRSKKIGKDRIVVDVDVSSMAIPTLVDIDPINKENYNAIVKVFGTGREKSFEEEVKEYDDYMATESNAEDGSEVNKMTDKRLIELAKKVKEIVLSAKKSLGEDLGGNSILDLVADNLPSIPLEVLRKALIMAGYYISPIKKKEIVDIKNSNKIWPYYFDSPVAIVNGKMLPYEELELGTDPDEVLRGKKIWVKFDDEQGFLIKSIQPLGPFNSKKEAQEAVAEYALKNNLELYHGD